LLDYRLQKTSLLAKVWISLKVISLQMHLLSFENIPPTKLEWGNIQLQHAIYYTKTAPYKNML
jgi:hypothetical protein